MIGWAKPQLNSHFWYNKASSGCPDSHTFMKLLQLNSTLLICSQNLILLKEGLWTLCQCETRSFCKDEEPWRSPAHEINISLNHTKMSEGLLRLHDLSQSTLSVREHPCTCWNYKRVEWKQSAAVATITGRARIRLKLMERIVFFRPTLIILFIFIFTI